MELGGGYPEVLLRGHAGTKEWYDAYLTTYLERDLRSLLDIGKLNDFRVVLGLLAARTAQELNLSSIAREAGVSEKTVAAWISVLEASYLILSVPSFHRNLGKRLVKRPKLFFWDTGLVCHLTGIRSREVLERGPMAGALFENYVIAEVAKDAAHRGLDRRIFRRIVFGEVKRRITVRPEDLKNINILREASRKMRSEGWSIEGLLVNTGNGEDTLPDGNVVRGVGKGNGRIVP